MKKTLPSFFLLVVFITLLVFLIDIQLAEAAVGDIKVTVTREGDSAAIQGATVEVLCTGGAYNQLSGNPTTDASGVVQAAPVVGSSCDDTDSIDVRVSKDGYVTKTDASAGTYVAANNPSADISVSNVQFAYKITLISSQVLSTDITGSVTALTVGDDTGEDTCTLSGGAWYCPVVLANSDGTLTSTPTLDGYVQKNYNLVTGTNRTANTDSQVSDTIANIEYSHKVTGQDELGNSLTSATVTVGGTSCTESAGVYYCPTPVASDGGTDDVIAIKNGYVTWNANSTDRTANTSVQATYISANQFAYKITSISSQVLSTDITGSVTALTVGDDTGEDTCTLSGGAWYCPVVLANSDGTLTSTPTLDGYVQKNYNLVTGTNRTANTDSQKSDTVTGMEYAVKVTVDDSMTENNSISGATVTTGDTYGVTCSENGTTANYYCVVPVAHTGVTVKIEKDGYVTNTTNTFTDRTADTDSQRVVTNTDVDLAVRISVIQVNGVLISGATVTTGDAYSTTCNEDGNTAVYDCAVPLADTGTNVQIVKVGYVTKIESNAWTDRTSATDPQSSATVTGESIAFYPSGRLIKEKPIIGMTIKELEAKIVEISAKITQLKTQLQQLLKEEIAPEIPTDYTFTINLKYGQKSDDVRYLQTFLKTQGPEIYPEGLVTGCFGPLTQTAVIRFQEKYAEEVLSPWELTEGTGFVGSTTRAKLNTLFGAKD